ncbi:hypothetical protein DM860_002876 [Cuscuta australis]|uniref:RIN4 pathogenic type III effector avirulence factor Avr cleavage site domain-containing protein n=1 Tax=Cuscuta australis TaxID=267555 RepID=A0A328D605_9ASTE|nr:hypothetical protein DM860_002876 [Cuscuta australis]
MNTDGSYLTQDQLTSKWSHINYKVRKFIEVYEECARSRRSGTNDADVLRLATTRYQDDGHQGKMPIDLWRILSRSPKWQQLNNPDGGSSKKRSSVDAEEKGRALPKFGEWDVNDPASAEGFTVIFGKARNEKRSQGPKPAECPSKRDSAHNKREEATLGKPQSVSCFL